MLTKYIFGAHGVCLCYDITDDQSFKDLYDWKIAVDKTYKEAMNSDVPGPPIKEPKIFLLGNKADLAGYRRVTEKQHDDFIKSENLTNGFYVSAKSGEMISTVFHQLTSLIFNIHVTDEELEYTQKVLTATIVQDNTQGDLTEEEKKIIEEDRKLYEEQQLQIQKELEKKKDKVCCIIS